MGTLAYKLESSNRPKVVSLVLGSEAGMKSCKDDLYGSGKGRD